MSKFRITYRLNEGRETAGIKERGENGPPKRGDDRADGQGQHEKSGLNMFTTDFGAWSSPFDEETRKLEQIIRQSGSRSHEKSDPETGYFADAWPGKNEPDTPVFPHAVPVASARGRGTSLLKVMTTVSGAVVTGLFIGMFILALFGDKAGLFPETPTSQTSAPAEGSFPEQSTGAPAASAADSPPAGDPNDSAADWLEVDIPAQTYFMLQNGIFTTAQGAQTAEKQLAANGFAAYTQHTDKYYVFAGVTATKDDALDLRKHMEEKKLEAYIKTIDLPQISKVHWTGSRASALDDFFLSARNLARSISGLTALYLEESRPLTDEAAKQLERDFQTWSAAAAKLAGTVPRDAEQAYAEIGKAVNTAAVAMDAYRKKPEAAYLREAQSALLQYILAETEFWAKLSAQT
ncbi:MAG TPA: SPOR domain-containing protein [Bacilli bacterium]